jgi:WD40 repeat protein
MADPTYIFALGGATQSGLHLIYMSKDMSKKVFVPVEGQVMYIKFVDENKMVVTDRLGNVKLYGTADESVNLLHKHECGSRCVAVHKKYVATGGLDCIMVSDLTTGNVRKIRVETNDEFVVSLDISPDGTKLASMSNDGSMRTWSLQSLEENKDEDEDEENPLFFTLPVRNSRDERVLFTRDGKKILVSTGGNNVFIYDAEINPHDTTIFDIQPTTCIDYVTPVLSMKITSDNMLITEHKDRNDMCFRTFDMTALKNGHIISTPGRRTLQEWSVTPDGKYIVGQTDQDPVMMWGVASPLISKGKKNYPRFLQGFDCSQTDNPNPFDS